jgi:diguanylate cyclase (GGDEF)-like protein
VLQLIGQGLRESCREYDYVARMGGDEFVLVLPNLPRELVRVRMEQIAQMVRDIGGLCEQDALGISCGEAFYPQDGRDAEDLLAAADRRMYKAKQAQKTEHSAEEMASDFRQLSKALSEVASTRLVN